MLQQLRGCFKEYVEVSLDPEAIAQADARWENSQAADDRFSVRSKLFSQEQVTENLRQRQERQLKEDRIRAEAAKKRERRRAYRKGGAEKRDWQYLAECEEEAPSSGGVLQEHCPGRDWEVIWDDTTVKPKDSKPETECKEPEKYHEAAIPDAQTKHKKRRRRRQRRSKVIGETTYEGW